MDRRLSEEEHKVQDQAQLGDQSQPVLSSDHLDLPKVATTGVDREQAPVPRLAVSEERPAVPDLTNVPAPMSDAQRVVILKQAVLAEEAHLKTMYSKKVLGPAVAGVLDKLTGEIFIDINDPNGALPSPMAPQIGERLTQMPADVLRKYAAMTKGAGSHAEVKALNKAFLKRPDAKRSDFLVYVNKTYSDSKTHGKPYLSRAEMPFMTCPHCEYILDGCDIDSNPK